MNLISIRRITRPIPGLLTSCHWWLRYWSPLALEWLISFCGSMVTSLSAQVLVQERTCRKAQLPFAPIFLEKIMSWSPVMEVSQRQCFPMSHGKIYYKSSVDANWLFKSPPLHLTNRKIKWIKWILNANRFTANHFIRCTKTIRTETHQNQQLQGLEVVQRYSEEELSYDDDNQALSGCLLQHGSQYFKVNFIGTTHTARCWRQ